MALSKIDAVNFLTGTIPSGNIATSSLAAAATGKILQIVQGSHASSVETTSTSYVDGGLSASITPSATSSKVLVMVNQSLRTRRDSSGDAQGGAIKLLRDTTTIIGGTQAYEIYLEITGATMIDKYSRTCLEILDTPSSTSSLTYKIQGKAYQSGWKVHFQPGSIPSIITLMEIAG